MVKYHIAPDEVIDVLKSEALRSNVASLISDWGYNNVNEQTLSAFIFSEVINSIYHNEERNANSSRPFVLEHTRKLEEECDEEECYSKTGNVRADLALIANSTGIPFLWIEVKHIHNESPLTKAKMPAFRCDIKHASQFTRGACIIFYEDILNISNSEFQELEGLAKELEVEFINIQVGGN